MGLFDDDYLVSDSGAAPPASDMMMPAGIGLEQDPAPVEDRVVPRDAVGASAGGSGMSTRERIGLSLAGFGHAISGKGGTNPVYSYMENEKKEKLLKLQEFKIHTDSLQDGVKMAKNLQGPARKQFIDAYAKQLDAVRPDLGETFRSLANQPDMGTVLAKYADKSPTLQRLIEVDPTGAAALKIMASPDGMKTINAEIDSGVMPTLIEKANTFRMGWQQLVPPEMLERFNRDGAITASELMEANQWVKTNKKDMAAITLSDEEIQVINRNAEAFYGATGILGPKEEQSLLKDRAKGVDKDKAPTTRTIRQGNMEIQQEWRDGKWHEVGRGAKGSGVTINMPSSSGFGVNPDTGKSGHYTIGKDGEVRWDKVAPLPKAGEEKARKDSEAATATVSSVRKRIETMSAQLQGNTGIVGPAGMVRRGVETARGIVDAGVETPAIDYQNNMRLLLSDVRKIVEKDPNLSKDEREALYETLGGGITQTPGSAIRTLNNVLEYVEGKAATGPSRNAEPSQADLEFTAKKHGITVEEVKRRLKAGQK